MNMYRFLLPVVIAGLLATQLTGCGFSMSTCAIERHDTVENSKGLRCIFTNCQEVKGS